MKTYKPLKAILIAMLSLTLITQISYAQRGGRGGSHFGGTRFGGSSFGGAIGFNRSSFNYSRSPITINRISYTPRIMSYGRRNHLPFFYSRIAYMGYPFYYTNGLFYASYGDYYGLVAPPFGLTLGFLPRGYWGFNFGGFPYYYYSGVFYRSTNDNQYQVVQPPVGAEVPNLPKDAKPIVVNDQKLYEYLGTYYKEVMGADGKIKYIVQGKDGVLNTDNVSEVTVENNNSSNAKITNYIPSIGDIVLQLPSQTMIVIVNGKKLFVTPEHIYYEEFIDGNVLKYKIVGK